ncbi:hypothetical protein F4553_002805 [Allocatelliglobosispora scoriae]|uniref:Uncharacterized protein n=1 Tax=Allocatelliglobosispora scoriae TaxID=643052 RepID=A0A841BQ50_9ACTN|nr:permease prefix domain 1-containing protein [Allocatelliglobosispora scoriae]MBB5869426.1 hypothetical protein [Allocatelliglobosispora scoriae]
MTAIDDFVTSLGGRLRGPSPLVDDVLTEVRDGLWDAASAYRRGGLGVVEAERRAVADFGRVDELAGEFQRELAMTQGRRTALKLGVMLPLAVFLSGLSWHHLHPASAPGAQFSPPQDYLTFARLVDLFGYGSGAFFLVMWLLLGPGARLLPMPRWVPWALGRAAAGMVSASLLAGTGLLAMSVIWAPQALLSAAMGANMIVWTVCFTLVIRSTSRCLHAS